MSSVRTAVPDSLVSIVLPVCDGEHFVGAAIESALGQTHRNLEVIVVDDGSRDKTRSIVEERAAQDSRVRIVSQSNLGVAAARNRGIAEARGEFIAPLDADDLWDPTKVARQLACMHEDTGLVYCWWVSIDGDGAPLDTSPPWNFEGHCADVLVEVNFTGNASVPLYRRRALEAAGGYDASLRARGAEGCEDWDLALKVAERSQVGLVPAVLVGYRRHAGSMSKRHQRMWHSHELMLRGTHERRPGLRRAVMRQSRRQFSLYLAGSAFRAGAHAEAVGWGLRALGSTVTLRALPYFLRVIADARHRTKPAPHEVIGPGSYFGSWQLPQSLIPYDRFYSRRNSVRA